MTRNALRSRRSANRLTRFGPFVPVQLERPAKGVPRAGKIVELCILIFIGILNPGWERAVRAGDPRAIGQGSRSGEAARTGEQEADEEVKTPDQKLLSYIFSPVVGRYPREETRQDLGLNNLFTHGWSVGWDEPDEAPDDAPRFSLLRIHRAFWERELRYSHTYTPGAEDGEVDEQEGELELELPVNRRFLIELEGAFVGRKPDGESWRIRGGDLKITPQIMLIETRDVSFSSGLVVRTPTGGSSVGEGRTSLAPYLAFWRDLGMRVGLHSYLGAEFLLDGFGSGAPHAVLQFAAAPTITVTPRRTPYFGNATLFLEANGESGFGGEDDNTTLAVLPGLRWLLCKEIWLAGGYEIGVAGTGELDDRIRLSLYRDF